MGVFIFLNCQNGTKLRKAYIYDGEFLQKELTAFTF